MVILRYVFFGEFVVPLGHKMQIHISSPVHQYGYIYGVIYLGHVETLRGLYNLFLFYISSHNMCKSNSCLYLGQDLRLDLNATFLIIVTENYKFGF